MIASARTPVERTRTALCVNICRGFSCGNPAEPYVGNPTPVGSGQGCGWTGRLTVIVGIDRLSAGRMPAGA